MMRTGRHLRDAVLHLLVVDHHRVLRAGQRHREHAPDSDGRRPQGDGQVQIVVMRSYGEEKAEEPQPDDFTLSRPDFIALNLSGTVPGPLGQDPGGFVDIDDPANRARARGQPRHGGFRQQASPA